MITQNEISKANVSAFPWRPFSVVLWLVALGLPCLVSVPYQAGVWSPGWSCFVFGIFSALPGSVGPYPTGILAWASNFLLFMVWRSTRVRQRVGILALILAASVFLIHTGPGDHGIGSTKPYAAGYGAFVWFLSFVFTLVSPWLRWPSVIADRLKSEWKIFCCLLPLVIVAWGLSYYYAEYELTIKATPNVYACNKTFGIERDKTAAGQSDQFHLLLRRGGRIVKIPASILTVDMIAADGGAARPGSETSKQILTDYEKCANSLGEKISALLPLHSETLMQMKERENPLPNPIDSQVVSETVLAEGPLNDLTLVQAKSSSEGKTLVYALPENPQSSLQISIGENSENSTCWYMEKIKKSAPGVTPFSLNQGNGLIYFVEGNGNLILLHGTRCLTVSSIGFDKDNVFSMFPKIAAQLKL